MQDYYYYYYYYYYEKSYSVWDGPLTWFSFFDVDGEGEL